MFSPTYSSAIVILLATILPLVGIKFESEQLTQLVQAALVLISGVFIAYRRYKSGDITIAGSYKK